jgi:hypothetical protein
VTDRPHEAACDDAPDGLSRPGLQAEIDDCLGRLPIENRLGVESIEIVRGSQVGEPALAVDVELRLGGTGGARHMPVRSRTWVNGYFEGKGRADTCRSLMFPPDVLAITVPTVVVEQIAGHSIVRGVMCLLRHEGVGGPAGT